MNRMVYTSLVGSGLWEGNGLLEKAHRKQATPPAPLLQSQCPAGFRSRGMLRWPGTPLVLGRLEFHVSARGPRAGQQREPETFWESHFICQIFSKSLSPGLHIASYFSPTALTLTYYRGFKGISRNEEQHKHIISLTCFKMTLLAVPNSSFNAPLLKRGLHKAHMIKLFRRAQRTET